MSKTDAAKPAVVTDKQWAELEVAFGYDKGLLGAIQRLRANGNAPTPANVLFGDRQHMRGVDRLNDGIRRKCPGLGLWFGRTEAWAPTSGSPPDRLLAFVPK